MGCALVGDGPAAAETISLSLGTNGTVDDPEPAGVDVIGANRVPEHQGVGAGTAIVPGAGPCLFVIADAQNDMHPAINLDRAVEPHRDFQVLAHPIGVAACWGGDDGHLQHLGPAVHKMVDIGWDAPVFAVDFRAVGFGQDGAVAAVVAVRDLNAVDVDIVAGDRVFKGQGVGPGTADVAGAFVLHVAALAEEEAKVDFPAFHYHFLGKPLLDADSTAALVFAGNRQRFDPGLRRSRAIVVFYRDAA